MSAEYDSRDAAHSTTSQLLFALQGGNVLAVLSILAFRPFPGPVGPDARDNLVLTVGVLSLFSAGLLFLASAIRRDATPWRFVTLILNATQIGRLIPGVVAIAAWADEGTLAAMLWAILFVPFLGVLAAVGVVMTVRELRKSRRRRLAREV